MYKRQLQAASEIPESVGDDLTAVEWFECYLANAVNALFVAVVMRYYIVDLFFNYLGMGWRDMITNTLLMVGTVTVALYVWSVYIVNFLTGLLPQSRKDKVA